MYVDVHTHLTHDKFHTDVWDVVDRAKKAGVGALVVNGLEPTSNRTILEMAQKDPAIRPALGIYPLDAINHLKPELPFPLASFDVDAEIQFIDSMAAQGRVFAIGECGLDGHWVGPETFPEQERVFRALIEVAKKHDLPLIIHTRKLEQRSMEILREHQVQRVNFHCFGGKTRLAIEAAEKEGWWFSIPANARKSENFTKMLKQLPLEKILTETDAPFLAPEKGTRNEPIHVMDTVAYFGELRNMSTEQAKEQVWKNFQTLFVPI